MHLHPHARGASSVRLAVACYLAIAANCFGADTNTYLRIHFQTNSAGETIVQYGNKIATSLSNATQILNFTKIVQNKGTNAAEVSIIPAEAITVVTSDQ